MSLPFTSKGLWIVILLVSPCSCSSLMDQWGSEKAARRATVLVLMYGIAAGICNGLDR